LTESLPPSIEEIIKLKYVFGKTRPLAIIPLLVKGKVPAVKWRSAFEVGPWSDEEIAAVWKKFPPGTLNPGLACGPLSGGGVVVLDADNDAGVNWLRMRCVASEVETVTRRGRHIYMSLPPGVEVRNAADVLKSRKKFISESLAAGFDVVIRHKDDDKAQAEEMLRAEEARKAAEAAGVEMGPLIDVRGSGGQVVLPGAIHESGFRYKMADPWHERSRMQVFDAGLFPKPQIDRAATRTKVQVPSSPEPATSDQRVTRARAYLAKIPGAVSGAGGHDTLFNAACRLVLGFALDADQAMSLLVSDYNPRCQPEWSHAELEHKVADACKLAASGAEVGGLLAEDKRKPTLALKAKSTAVGSSGGQAPSAASAAVQAPDQNAGEEEDVKAWDRLWRARGVDFGQLVAMGLAWDRKKVSGNWLLPKTVNNAVAVLTLSPRFAGRLAHNAKDMINEIDGRRMTDFDEVAIASAIGHLWHDEYPRQAALDAINQVCHYASYDPWQQFISSLPEWDGTDYLALFLSKVLGFKDQGNGQWRQVYCEWRHQLTGAMARGIVPGTKVHTILILVGSQGRNKSTLLKRLFNGRGDEWDFFTDQKFKLDDKDGMMLISRYHACEWSEAEHAKNPKAIDTIKAFLAQGADEFRPPYGRNLVRRPRRVVFFATSNEGHGLLHDDTGNRRFYICDIANQVLNLDALDSIRLGLWSQILDVYNRHVDASRALDKGPDSAAEAEFHATRWWYEADEEQARARSLDRYQEESPYLEAVADWLQSRVKWFTANEVVDSVLRLAPGHANKAVRNEVTKALRQAGCKRHKRRIGSSTVWVWEPPKASQGPEEEDQGF